LGVVLGDADTERRPISSRRTKLPLCFDLYLLSEASPCWSVVGVVGVR